VGIHANPFCKLDYMWYVCLDFINTLYLYLCFLVLLRCMYKFLYVGISARLCVFVCVPIYVALDYVCIFIKVQL